MNKFLTTTKEYNKRLKICKACEYYFKPTGSCKKCGCFMRIKAKLSALSCPIKKWLRTSIIEESKMVSPELLKEIKEIWPDIKTKRAKNHKIKFKMIEIYNTLYNTGYSTNTSCGSCLHSVYQGIKLIHDKYIKKDG